MAETVSLKNSRKKLFSGLLISLFGLAALPKVFSLNTSIPIGKDDSLPVQEQLLLSEMDGLLSEKDARKVLRSLEFPVATFHVVGRNEWLEKIAQEYGIPAIALRSTNNLEDTYLRPGQTIIVQNKKGMIHSSKADEPLDNVLQSYEKLGGKRENILAMNSLDESVSVKEGKLVLQEGALLWIPDARRSFPYLSSPVAWRRISSRFGFRRHPVRKTRLFHEGFDMVAGYGAPVFSGDKGTVVFAGWKGGYGNMVEIRHAKITTCYGHLSKIVVQVGQTVKRKQLIGRVGSTGLSTGPHLHFEVRRNSDGKPITPRKYLF